jgi:hypothetical protein
MYLNEWRTTMLKNVITINSDKNLVQCLELLFTKLQKVHQGLLHNYGNIEGSLAGQFISVCQNVKACSQALQNPAPTFEGVASQFRTAVGVWKRCQAEKLRIYNNSDKFDGELGHKENAYYMAITRDATPLY